MTLCKFYQQGNCRYGSNCRFEHPGVGDGRGQSRVRFDVPSSRSARADGALRDALAKYSITTDGIKRDLTTDAPEWILSSYGPGRNAPGLLFEGFPREQSFEEMRLHYYEAKALGNEQRALDEAQELWQNAKQQMETAVNDLDGAARFILDAEHKHPNKLDMCRELSKGAPFGVFTSGRSKAQTAPRPNPFSTTPNGSSPAFGQPAALGQRPNPFGPPALGQSAQSTSGFGQVSKQEQPSPFGQYSQPGAPAFGQPAQTYSGFGQGQSASFSQSAPFAQPAQPGASAFGQSDPSSSGFAPSSQQSQPSPFGQTSQTAGPAFGHNAPTTSAFGQPSALGARPNPFAAPAFGQTAQPAAGPGSAFGQVSQMVDARPNPFASADTTGNAFATANNNAPPNPANPFGQALQNQTNGPFKGNGVLNPFGQASPVTHTSFASAAQGQSIVAPAGAAPAVGKASPYPPGSTREHPSIESYATKNMDGTLATFKGKPVTYRGSVPGFTDFGGQWVRIWFPNGAPNYYKDTELPADQYDDMSKTQWTAFAETGTFQQGLLPALPPPRDCTRWDF